MLAASFSHSPSLSIHEGRPFTTSLDVARVFNKRHDNVLRDIDLLLSQLPENSIQLKFEECFQEQKNSFGIKQVRYYRLYRDGFMLLVMGYSGQKALALKVAYIQAFNALEERLAHQEDAQHAARLVWSLGAAQKRRVRAAARYRSLGLGQAAIGKVLGVHGREVSRLLQVAQLMGFLSPAPQAQQIEQGRLF